MASQKLESALAVDGVRAVEELDSRLSKIRRPGVGRRDREAAVEVPGRGSVDAGAITYLLDGKQHIAVTAGSSVIVFGLP